MEQMADVRENVASPKTKIIVGEPIGAGSGAIHAEGMDVQAAGEQLVEETEAHLRQVAEGAPGCCIDGRHCGMCMDGKPTELRPSVAGGPLVTAYAAAELVGWFATDAGNSEARMAFVHAHLKNKGIVSGAHCDEAASMANFEDDKGNGKTGCGANDKLPAILQTLHDNKEAIDDFTRNLLHDDYDVASTNYVSASELKERHQDWQPRVMINEIGADEDEGQHNIEILESDETPTHGHKELAVVFNEAEGTTIDRDALFAATGKQVFDVDMWYLRKVAYAMATGPNAAEQESQLLHAMVAYQVATYLTLCDGSQRTVHIPKDYVLAA